MSSVRVALPHTHVVIVMALAMLPLGVITWSTVVLSYPDATASERTTEVFDSKAGGFFGWVLHDQQ